MVLVDTSVWVEHLRRGLPALAEALNSGVVLCHPFVVGELACGNLKNRHEILALLQTLCTCPVAAHDEVLRFIELHRLMGLGLGYIDVHLLASAKLTNTPLWTFDHTLSRAAARLEIAYT